jgi:hypothetical protein
MDNQQMNLFAFNANWEKIRENKFFRGNYSPFNSPRTELEARRNAMTRTWNLNMREYIHEPRS